MANPVVTPVAPEATLPAAPAPVVATPAPATAPPAATAEAAAPTPVATPTPAASEPPSFLSDAKPATATPAPATPPTATPEPTAPATVQPAPVVKPTYEAFKLPEGVTLDAAQATKFTDALAAFETDSRTDHAKVQALGQQFMDMYAAEAQAAAQRSTQQLLDNFNATRETWRNEIKADPNFGGDKLSKTASDCGAFIEQYGGSAEDVAAIRQVFRVTGAGDHPAIVRLFARAAQAVAREGSPVPATTPKSPTIASRTQRRYGNSLNGSGA